MEKSNHLCIKGFREEWAWTPRQWTCLTGDAGIGDPSLANAEKGKRFLDRVSTQRASFITEFARADRKSIYED